jgi:ABC-2 type transport system permease protein
VNHSRKRRLLIWLNVVLMCVLMAAFLVGVNLVAHTRFARIDMTTDRVWEISPQSRQILKSAKYDLEIYLNAVSEGPSAQEKSLPEAWRRTILLLSEMANQNPKIKVAPIIEGSATQAKVFSLFSRPEPNMIYFVYRTADEKPLSRALSVGDLFNGNPQTGEILDYFGESRIISTIAQLISDRKLKIYATTEHQEIPPTSSDRRGLSALTGRLMALENAEFKPLNLMRDKAVPDDADLVFIAWPTSDFTTAETDALTKYWTRGGRLFVAVHPLSPNPLSELRKFLETCGVRMNRDIVLDAQRELGDSGSLAVRRYGAHPVNQHMHGLPFRVDVSGSVEANIVNKRMQAMPLFFSSETCWTELDLPPKPGVSRHNPGERWGPVPLGVAAEEATATKPARIIAWGSPIPLINEKNMIQDTPNEFTLGYIVNNFRWLTEREMLISAPTESRRPRMRPFSPPPGSDAVIGWISLAGVPLLGVALGGLAWYFRRK